MKPEPYVVTIGPVCVDDFYSADEWPPLGSKGLVKAIDTIVGGMIPNAACVFAGLGVKTYHFDILNRGAQTDRMLDDLRGYGVDVSAVVYDDSVPDPKCIIVLTPGERTILVVDSEKPMVAVEGALLELFRNAAYIYTTIYEFNNLKNAGALADDLKAHGAKLVFDVETSTFGSGYETLLAKANLLFFNQYGFDMIRGDESEGDFCRRLFANGTEFVVLTLGKDGCRVMTPGESVEVAGLEVEVVDPTGAGDTFNSSFVRCLLTGMDITRSAKFANAAAAHSVTKLGAKGGVNTAERVEELMAAFYF